MSRLQRSRRRSAGRSGRTAILMLASTLLIAAPAVGLSAPTVGFVENWPGTSAQGWGGSIAVTFSNPGTGGVGGAGDGFLSMGLSSKGHLGARSTGPEYVGNWQAAGITEVRFYLNDINADEPLEIHFSLGNFGNLWQYNVGFIPPLHQWAPFTVDLTNPSAFTHTIAIDGQGFAEALQNVQVVHLRHDLPPFMQLPDSIVGDVGIDRLLLTNGVVDVSGSLPSIERPIELAPLYPNPSRGNVAVGVVTMDDGPVTIQVVDPQGRVVFESGLKSRAPGTRLWTWDGRNEGGRRLPAGIYRVRAFGRAGGMSRSLVMLD